MEYDDGTGNVALDFDDLHLVVPMKTILGLHKSTSNTFQPYYLISATLDTLNSIETILG